MTLSLPPRGIEVVLLTLLIGAALYDIRYRRIPNWLTVGGVAIGVALNAFLGPPVGGWPFAVKGMVLGFGAYFLLYALHAMGAGDVKLMAAVGALVGWQNWVGIFMLTAIMGGMAALILAVARKRLGNTLWNVGFILTEMKSGRPAYLGKEELDVKSRKSLGLPHGAVIAMATICFLGLSAYFTR
ncbi:MAG: A24 family peptidase [Acidobacteriia bacterium]|nr:A24 family peptidase [Terriglobia bacterium]